MLIVAHAPSPNTERVRDAIVAGAHSPEIEGVDVVSQSPFATTSEHVIASQGVILLTPENLGYMSGALKDFFDRCYYPCLEKTQGLPYALCVRAGQGGGDGTRRAVESIATGLRWRAMAEPLVFRGAWNEDFVAQARELGMTMAVGLEAGVF